ncbi:bifunctional glycoside hydrolase 114/ polysaccharide deacetylase family protein [Legionella waltersii]|uniref:Glycoside-hydrolase family GH114 TIM-barrel domain-containing protein n=1 Tax=Legionella waltersii TaxID=66969 RepID=A0A0W1A4K6_9GAMM|nr:endo alpha-1,4 polygalactosaminidase [Legionella waltersii]KTD76286.1 hypothetical protein Lwal_2008 [Legionella waltersii]SNV13427.1 Uncharacterized conserved protein [Legionella waltersii]
MKRSCSINFFSCFNRDWYRLMIGLLAWLFLPTALFPMSADTRVAFYYGNKWPIDGVRAFNIVVVDPTDKIASQYNTESSELYAYVSVGETDSDAEYISKINKEWIIGKNADWNSVVMDLSNPKWRSFLLTELIEPLWAKGYRGFFFDTLDSYTLTKKSPTEQQAGLVDFIKSVKKKYPDAKLILNRGFEIIPNVHEEIEAVAAESLFSEWVPKSKTYRPVPEKSMRWLLNALQKVKTEFQLPIIVIDYLPVNEKQQARELAKKIDQLGFIPWVANGSLSHLGQGTVEVLPRKILILLDPGDKKDEVNEKAYQPLVFPLQYMGYIPVLWTLGASFPEDINNDDYAGIIAWFNHPVTKYPKQLNEFLLKQLNNRIPIVLFNYLGLPENSSFLTKFGINYSKPTRSPKAVTQTFFSNIFGFEIQLKANIINFFPLSVSNAKPLVQVTSDNHQIQTAGAITPFGGFILEPYVLGELPQGQNRWVIDPFQFLKMALHLPEIPIPDLTTSNGRRMLMIHVDGDGYISRVPWDAEAYPGDLMLEQIFKKYQLPITISVIQREFEIIKSNVRAYSHLVKIAKETFALPWVEIATHTYSHPLEWAKLEEGKENKKYLSYPDEHYRFNYENEVVGSSTFINENLAPKDKKVRVVLWSGDGMVSIKPLQIVANANLLNLNGMSDLYLPESKSITNLSGLGRFVGGYFQVFSPIANDFVYTDDWTQPLYRFANVIETFKLTESPRRYKLISIYYHFYSALDQGAFRALKHVYEWAVKQKTTPIHVSDYILKVQAFNHLVIAKTLNDGWLITNNSPLREFRIPMSMGTPIVSAKDNVLGFNQANDDYYIHLGASPTAYLNVSRASHLSQDKPYLIEANSDEVFWKETGNNQYLLELKGAVPVEFQLANIERCKVSQSGTIITAGQDGTFSLKDKLSGQISIQCD